MVGLANPGTEFEGSRHNIGAEVVHLLSRRHGVGRLRGMKGQLAAVEEVQIGDARVVLAVPTTYMNESGNAVRPLVRRFVVEDLAHLVVVHDELDLPPGRLRIKLGGGTAGHNGLKSIQAHLRTPDFARIRIGIGKPPGRQAGADYVLKRPSRADRSLLDVAVSQSADAVEVIATEGLAVAMNRYNGSAQET